MIDTSYIPPIGEYNIELPYPIVCEVAKYRGVSFPKTGIILLLPTIAFTTIIEAGARLLLDDFLQELKNE